MLFQFYHGIRVRLQLLLSWEICTSPSCFTLYPTNTPKLVILVMIPGNTMPCFIIDTPDCFISLQKLFYLLPPGHDPVFPNSFRISLMVNSPAVSETYLFLLTCLRSSRSCYKIGNRACRVFCHGLNDSIAFRVWRCCQAGWPPRGCAGSPRTAQMFWYVDLLFFSASRVLKAPCCTRYSTVFFCSDALSPDTYISKCLLADIQGQRPHGSHNFLRYSASSSFNLCWFTSCWYCPTPIDLDQSLPIRLVKQPSSNAYCPAHGNVLVGKLFKGRFRSGINRSAAFIHHKNPYRFAKINAPRKSFRFTTGGSVANATNRFYMVAICQKF